MRGLDRSQPEHPEHREAVFGAGAHRRRRRCRGCEQPVKRAPAAPPRTSRGRRACRSSRSRATVAVRRSRTPSVAGAPGRTAQASVTDARSWPRRRVRRTCVAPTGPSTSGSSIAVTSSPSRNVVTPERTNQSSIGMRRVPSGPATTTSAPYTSRAGAVSAAGDALQMLPASVARFRICTDPTTSAASASAANRRSDRRVLGDVGHHGPGADHQPVPLVPDPRRQLRHPLHVDHHVGRDRPVAETDDQVRPAGQRPRRRAHAPSATRLPRSAAPVVRRRTAAWQGQRTRSTSSSRTCGVAARTK